MPNDTDIDKIKIQFQGEKKELQIEEAVILLESLLDAMTAYHDAKINGAHTISSTKFVRPDFGIPILIFPFFFHPSVYHYSKFNAFLRDYFSNVKQELSFYNDVHKS